MDTARRNRSIGFLCLVVTSFGWALNWPLMKLLLQQWPPLFARGLAGVLAAVILAALALSRREPLKVPRAAIPRLVFASFTNVFAWMGFGTVAMKYVTVGEGRADRLHHADLGDAVRLAVPACAPDRPRCR
jgi:drug/metabolite transporter (DMT)-like permease